MFWYQYLLQSHITRHAYLNLYVVTEAGFFLRHCHEITTIHYSDQWQHAKSLAITVMAKCHTKEQNLFQTTQLHTRLAWGAPPFSRSDLRGVLSVTLRCQIGRRETKQQTFETTTQQTGNGRIIIIVIGLHKLYALQRVLH